MPIHLSEEQLERARRQAPPDRLHDARPELDAGQALDHMRRYPPPGRIIYFYVVDEMMRLVGVVPTRRLLLAPVDKSIADIMIKSVVAIPDGATVLEACEFFTLHRLLAFPVVDGARRLLGVVDVDLYTEELAETGEHAPVERDDMFQLIGVRLTRLAAGPTAPGLSRPVSVVAL